MTLTTRQLDEDDLDFDLESEALTKWHITRVAMSEVARMSSETMLRLYRISRRQVRS